MNAFAASRAQVSLGEEYWSSTAKVLRWALESAYRHLDHCIVNMELATLAPEPDMALLSQARFRISQASLARRKLLDKACELLLDRASEAEAEAIAAVQRDSVAYGRASTDHIRRWPASAVAHDWPSYREASRNIRAQMKQSARTEQRVVLPLLARYDPD